MQSLPMPLAEDPRAEQRNLSSEPGRKAVEIGYTKPLVNHEKCLPGKRNLLQRGKTPSEGVCHPVVHPTQKYSNQGLKVELAPVKQLLRHQIERLGLNPTLVVDVGHRDHVVGPNHQVVTNEKMMKPHTGPEQSHELPPFG
ncbi:hypothetical protein NDU88_001468 [Pleurodeles waltl]|uniref:Uncharacterized protein n=1 Tax=Pleurodeles waltl TaxID=8319 RepID=A0AAV7UUE4_PLEWA|nr:hypothetical protein NDU88_001468 [Pleurodeles waltl]